MTDQQEADISGTDSGDGKRLPDEGTPTVARDDSGELPEGALAEGTVLAGRYRLGSQLGRGGMGVVWRAFDLKLRVEVALKSLHMHLAGGEKGLAMVRREVRAAREVISPNVCRIFDLIEVEGRELVSMEYVDGGTLLEMLKERGPLGLEEAQDVASQFLAGLEAIHRAGLVHRDVKPENIMITRAGRVVLMDFGLAKAEDSGAGTVSGTPAYMAPEQAAGLNVDARADVYSAGVVLAEMVSPGGIKDRSSRESVWEAVRHEPAKVPETPWAPVIKKAVAREPEQRYKSAHTLTRALEDITLRAEGAEDLTPYPGLASFTEDDAEYFFGREAEVESMWAKLEGPARLLGLVGPSGAGKTSFLRAGVVTSAAPGWTVVRCTPGTSAVASLRGALVPALGGDTKALTALATGDDDAIVSACSRWRSAHERALLVVDQFEELFTLNPRATQVRLAELLCRLPLDSEVHVLLSMRDDFLMECNRFEALRPAISDLTLLDPPTGANLRRALVQPATKCGYRFEDDDLIEEMLAEVVGERGALPMLAFATARLWEERSREAGLLTRESYHATGGVGGALAQHAEATIDRIGSERIAVVRELFRNLVTAEGTRAVREWDELLSVFDDGRRGAAVDVLRELIDARLLTSYEVHEESREPARRVEIIHESLLANWPRLVRWQTQDADAAQLRDQLRQAARTWDEHERSRDLLWTGSAFREFASWKERYPGGLSELEEAFGEAMTRHAGRRKRRRRLAVASTFVVLAVVLAVVGAFWRRSIAEARRADAANLFSLAQLRLEEHPSATIAYTIASLELADDPEVRRLAVEALWKGPTELRLWTNSYMWLEFSGDGHWLATADHEGGGGGGKLWPSDGGPPTSLEGSQVAKEIIFSPRGDLVAANMDSERQRMGLWSCPEGRLLRSFAFGDGTSTHFFVFSRDGERLITSTQKVTEQSTELVFRSWPVAGGEPDHMARLTVDPSSNWARPAMDPQRSRLAWVDGRRVHVAPLVGTTLDLASVTSIEHDRNVVGPTFDAEGLRLATEDLDGTVRFWSLERDPPELTRAFGAGPGEDRSAGNLRFAPSGQMLVSVGALLWDLTAPPDAEPVRLKRPDGMGYAMAFHPDGRWLATGNESPSVSLWPLARTYPRVLRGHEKRITGVVFTPDGTRLVSGANDGSVRVWPLSADSDERSRVLHQGAGYSDNPKSLAMAPDGSFVVAGSQQGWVRVLPLGDGPVRELGGFWDAVFQVAVGPESRHVAAGSGRNIREQAVVRVWDLESEEVRILDAGDGEMIMRLDFTADGDLWVSTGWRLRCWDLDADPPHIQEDFDFSRPEFKNDYLNGGNLDRRLALFKGPDSFWIQDLDTLESRELTSHAGSERCFLDRTGEIVLSTDPQGGIRVGRASGGQPHLLLGHEGGLSTAGMTPVAFSPDGRWIATGGMDATIRLWPMPDLSKPPLHTLPRDQLLAKLRSLTNLRVAADPESTSGWKIEVGPFPGWETVPTW